MHKRSFVRRLTTIGAFSLGLAGAAQVLAQETIRIGWLSSLTGPLSTGAIAENKGVEFAVDQLNKAGGISGRKLELLTRDTAGDPTKAVNFANQLVFQDKVHFILGPVNSGEALPTVPIVARAGVPNLLITALESQTDPVKYPRAFRTIFVNEQWLRASHNYAINVLKAKKIAIIGDTSGYGTATVKQSTEMLAAIGITPVYTVLVDSNRTSLTDEMAKAKAAGAEIVMPWTASTGLLARILNARGDMQWDVPVLGHVGIMSTAMKALLNKPEYWEKAYAVGLKNMTYGADGKLPESTRQLMEAIRPTLGGGTIDFSFGWIATGYDLVKVIEHAVKTAGSTDPAAIQKALEGTRDFKGYYATYTWGPSIRNGFQDSDLVVNVANSFKDGSYQRAPQ
ncbi:ABC transporter substrate-binding protein [Variovorax rhizosphaerae]|uniref:ABC transporter substrate-binding protein n=1 Tax=Variovorax rhizosphaerae TaxID=1836200 RepID=A0ABU8WW77_9BURK